MDAGAEDEFREFVVARSAALLGTGSGLARLPAGSTPTVLRAHDAHGHRTAERKPDTGLLPLPGG